VPPRRPLRDSTRIVRAGLPSPSQGQPFLPGPTFAGTYHLAGEPGSSNYAYGRYHNPTWTLYEQALSELEEGPVVAFSSGMAAVSAVLSSVLRPGDVLVMPSDGYYTARLLAQGHFQTMGVEVRTAPTADNAQLRCIEGARLLWLETPSNPSLDVCDIARLAAAGHDQGALVAVENTTATVLGQRPLALGADFSVAADTKALTGHGDILLGHVAVRDRQWADRLLTWRTQGGAIPGPMEVWLAHRSLATADVRLERMCANALVIAHFLSKRPEVGNLRYPGLSTDPAFPVASRQMRAFGCVVSFELRDRQTAERFLESCELILEATSFGGVLTTAERRARWGGDKVPEGFVRLSAGCEHADDLIDDLSQALGA
jgi:cystathionine gamma-lyase